ncbi:MAG TPA: hypothetical protein VEA69_16190 [Tepidisphaeraceae bacterium]|nr:hypothetical protein [Tepidisphaeraceae bacterium]
MAPQTEQPAVYLDLLVSDAPVEGGAPSGLGGDLSERIRRLQDFRRRHLEAVSAIDRALSQINHTLGDVDVLNEALVADDGVRPSARAEPGVRRKGRFALTAEVSVLEFVRQQGAPTTAQINDHWRREGRRGTANVTVLRLLRQNRIRRQHDPAVRGSRYMAVDAAGPVCG